MSYSVVEGGTGSHSVVKVILEDYAICLGAERLNYGNWLLIDVIE